MDSEPVAPGPGTAAEVDSLAARTSRVAAIRASLARSRADLEAGRTVAGETVSAEVRSMIERHQAQRRDGKAHG